MRSIVLTAFALAAFLISPLTSSQPAAAQAPQTITKEVPQGVYDFRQVAKEATPSVVFLKVHSNSKRAAVEDDDDDESDQNSLDLYSLDPFLRRFFSSPQREKSRPSSPKTQQGISQGSGFIVSSDGFILTNNHLVSQAGEILVVLNDGREFTAKVIGQDANTDVALIKIDAEGLPALSLGNSDDLEVGEWVLAIGNPLGLQASVSAGVVSAIGRNNLDLARIEDFIQTDAAINRGNSGGPLLDLQGKVIGINTAIVTSMGGGGYMGIGFAIPSNMAKHVMDQIINDGAVKRGYIGVAMQPVDNDLAQAFGLDRVEGALVTEVFKDSPAEKGGLKQGDIVLKIDNKSVANISSLRNSVAMMSPGKKVNLQVVRNGKLIAVPIEIALYPTATQETAQANEKFGFEVESLSPELAKLYGLGDEKGVVVSRVYPGTPAAWAGLRKGALIMAIDRNPINNIEEYNRQINQAKKQGNNKPILFLIRQGGDMRFVSFKVG